MFYADKNGRKTGPFHKSSLMVRIHSWARVGATLLACFEGGLQLRVRRKRRAMKQNSQS